MPSHRGQRGPEQPGQDVGGLLGVDAPAGGPGEAGDAVSRAERKKHQMRASFPIRCPCARRSPFGV